MEDLVFKLVGGQIARNGFYGTSALLPFNMIFDTDTTYVMYLSFAFGYRSNSLFEVNENAVCGSFRLLCDKVSTKISVIYGIGDNSELTTVSFFGLRELFLEGDQIRLNGRITLSHEKRKDYSIKLTYGMSL